MRHGVGLLQGYRNNIHWKLRINSESPIIHSSINSSVKVLKDTGYSFMMFFSQILCILWEFNQQKTYVWSTGGHCKYQFTNRLAIAEIHVGLEFGTFCRIGWRYGILKSAYINLIIQIWNWCSMWHAIFKHGRMLIDDLLKVGFITDFYVAISLMYI